MQAEIVITNVLNTKTAFGMVPETAESVFIPGKVAQAANIRVGKMVQALLVPNSNQPEKTPWMAVFIGPNQDLDGLADEIRADLESGPAMAHEVAQSIGHPVDLVARKLRDMRNNGMIVQEAIYAIRHADFFSADDD